MWGCIEVFDRPEAAVAIDHIPPPQPSHIVMPEVRAHAAAAALGWSNEYVWQWQPLTTTNAVLTGEDKDIRDVSPARFNPFDKDPPLDEKFANFEPKRTDTKPTDARKSEESQKVNIYSVHVELHLKFPYN